MLELLECMELLLIKFQCKVTQDWQIVDRTTLSEMNWTRRPLPWCSPSLYCYENNWGLSLCKNGEIPGLYVWNDSVRVMKWITETSCCSNVSIELISSRTLMECNSSKQHHKAQFYPAPRILFIELRSWFQENCNLIFMNNSIEMFWYLIGWV